MTDAISAAARSEASSVSASTWNFSRGQDRNPYSRATASCASASDGNSPALRRRFASRATAQIWTRGKGTRLGHVNSFRSRRVRTPGRKSRPTPATINDRTQVGLGPFRGPDAPCTPRRRYHPEARELTRPCRSLLRGVFGRVPDDLPEVSVGIAEIAGVDPPGTIVRSPGDSRAGLPRLGRARRRPRLCSATSWPMLNSPVFGGPKRNVGVLGEFAAGVEREHEAASEPEHHDGAGRVGLLVDELGGDDAVGLEPEAVAVEGERASRSPTASVITSMRGSIASLLMLEDTVVIEESMRPVESMCARLGVRHSVRAAS